jgi:hypothetical protein
MSKLTFGLGYFSLFTTWAFSETAWLSWVRFKSCNSGTGKSITTSLCLQIDRTINWKTWSKSVTVVRCLRRQDRLCSLTQADAVRIERRRLFVDDAMYETSHVPFNVYHVSAWFMKGRVSSRECTHLLFVTERKSRAWLFFLDSHCCCTITLHISFD